ncbi:MAG: selenium cofactor biosynthesis protein YqeC [Romboutsia sp.]|uniref:selenium cofactor biosynthesis protein YqeC n=1 Tax=Romboutsia sp. TaxID=1965302 RepID=UPI003F3F8A8A
MNKNKLIDLIDITKNDIITVIGSGGKTSLINYIASECKNNMSVLLTTTTKIYVPDDNLYSNIYMLEEENSLKSKIEDVANCTIVIGRYINKEKKIIGLDFRDLDNITINFDLTLIEGDGSKKKKLKGWNDTEPVVYEKTIKTIGVIDITSYNMDINHENIHRLKEFNDIIMNSDKKVSLSTLKSIILSKNGLFEKAIGEKILFINKVENDYYESLAIELIKSIRKVNSDINIIYGSIKNEIFKEWKKYDYSDNNGIWFIN